MSNEFWLLLGGSVYLMLSWMQTELERASQAPDACSAPMPDEAPVPPLPPLGPQPDPHPGIYRDRFGGLTPVGLKRDRYGVCYERNPQGFGWREVGSDPDEPYWVRRLN